MAIQLAPKQQGRRYLYALEEMESTVKAGERSSARAYQTKPLECRFLHTHYSTYTFIPDIVLPRRGHTDTEPCGMSI